MPVYVDTMKYQYGRMIMCHMVADTVEELHAMADKIGIQRKWFQNKRLPHYDICKAKKVLAIENGAVLIDNKKLVEIIKKFKRKKNV